MTVYDWDGPGSLPPAKVYDANGNRISRVLQCDTETGYVHMARVSSERVEYVETYYSAPMRVEFIPEDYVGDFSKWLEEN